MIRSRNDYICYDYGAKPKEPKANFTCSKATAPPHCGNEGLNALLSNATQSCHWGERDRTRLRYPRWEMAEIAGGTADLDQPGLRGTIKVVVSIGTNHQMRSQLHECLAQKPCQLSAVFHHRSNEYSRGALWHCGGGQA